MPPKSAAQRDPLPDYEDEICLPFEQKRFLLDFRPDLTDDYWKQERTDQLERFVIVPEDPYHEINGDLVPSNVVVFAEKHYLPAGVERKWTGHKITTLTGLLELIFRLAIGRFSRNPRALVKPRQEFVAAARQVLDAYGKSQAANVTLVGDEVVVATGAAAADSSTLDATVTDRVVEETDHEDREVGDTPTRSDAPEDAADVVMETDEDRSPCPRPNVRRGRDRGEETSDLDLSPEVDVEPVRKRAERTRRADVRPAVTTPSRKRKADAPPDRRPARRPKKTAPRAPSPSSDEDEDAEDAIARQLGSEKTTDASRRPSERAPTDIPSPDGSDASSEEDDDASQSSSEPVRPRIPFRDYIQSDTLWDRCKKIIAKCRGAKANDPNWGRLRDSLRLIVFVLKNDLPMTAIEDYLTEVASAKDGCLKIRTLRQRYKDWAPVGEYLVKKGIIKKWREKPLLTAKKLRNFFRGYDPGREQAAAVNMVKEELRASRVHRSRIG